MDKPSKNPGEVFEVDILELCRQDPEMMYAQGKQGGDFFVYKSQTDTNSALYFDFLHPLAERVRAGELPSKFLNEVQVQVYRNALVKPIPPKTFLDVRKNGKVYVAQIDVLGEDLQRIGFYLFGGDFGSTELGKKIAEVNPFLGLPFVYFTDKFPFLAFCEPHATGGIWPEKFHRDGNREVEDLFCRSELLNTLCVAVSRKHRDLLYGRVPLVFTPPDVRNTNVQEVISGLEARLPGKVERVDLREALANPTC